MILGYTCDKCKKTFAGTPATRQEGDLCNQCATEDKLFYLNDRLLTERRRLSAQQKVIQEIESEIASLKTTNPNELTEL